MNSTAVLEAGWHFVVIAFATPWFARLLLRRRSAMVLAIGVMVGGAAYHMAKYPGG